MDDKMILAHELIRAGKDIPKLNDKSDAVIAFFQLSRLWSDKINALCIDYDALVKELKRDHVFESFSYLAKFFVCFMSMKTDWAIDPRNEIAVKKCKEIVFWQPELAEICNEIKNLGELNASGGPFYWEHFFTSEKMEGKKSEWLALIPAWELSLIHKTLQQQFAALALKVLLEQGNEEVNEDDWILPLI